VTFLGDATLSCRVYLYRDLIQVPDSCESAMILYSDALQTRRIEDCSWPWSHRETQPGGSKKRLCRQRNSSSTASLVIIPCPSGTPLWPFPTGANTNRHTQISKPFSCPAKVDTSEKLNSSDDEIPSVALPLSALAANAQSKSSTILPHILMISTASSTTSCLSASVSWTATASNLVLKLFLISSPSSLLSKYQNVRQSSASSPSGQK